MMATKRKGVEEGNKGQIKNGKCMVTGDLTLGGKLTMQNQIVYYNTGNLKPV